MTLTLTKKFNLVTLTLTFDLLLKKLNLDHDFWTKSDRALILHISIPCDKTFLLIPIFLTYRPWRWLWLWPTFWKTWIGCRGCINPVRTDPDLVNENKNILLLNQSLSPGVGLLKETGEFSSLSDGLWQGTHRHSHLFVWRIRNKVYLAQVCISNYWAVSNTGV